MSTTQQGPATFPRPAHDKQETYPCWKKAKLTQMGMWWMLSGTGSRSSGAYCVKSVNAWSLRHEFTNRQRAHQTGN